MIVWKQTLNMRLLYLVMRRKRLRTNKHQCTGALVHRCTGALVHWCTGPLLHWCTGALVHCYTGALVHWCTDALVHWYTGALVHWCASAPVHWCRSALDKMASLDLSLRNWNTLPLPTKRRLLTTIEERTQNSHTVHVRAISQFYLMPSNALQKKIFWLTWHRRLLFWTPNKKSKTRE